MHKQTPSRSVDVAIPSYNNPTELLSCIHSVKSQLFDKTTTLHIIVCDDGSTNEIKMQLPRDDIEGVRFVRLDRNHGRAAARNAAAEAGKSPIVAFLDSDCEYHGFRSLENHIKTLEDRFALSLGGISAEGDGFWGRYQRAAVAAREQMAAAGDVSMLTTANCAILRSCFESLGGFNNNYHAYGFEDRDLIARAEMNHLSIAFNPHSRVIHKSQLALGAVAEKLFSAAKSSSKIFCQDHPDYYRRLIYHRFDMRLRGRFVKLAISPLARAAFKYRNKTERLLSVRCIPFWLKKGVVRIVCALSYAAGTLERS